MGVNVKTFAFQVYCAAGKDWTQAAVLCEQLAASQFTVAQANGATIIGSSINGKSFTWQVNPRWSLSDIADLARRTWGLTQTLSPADLTAFVSSPTPSRTYARFGDAYAG